MQCSSTYIVAHFPFKLVPIEAAVNSSIAGLDVRTEHFAVVAARVVQLPIVVVIVGLQLGDAHQFLLALVMQLLKHSREAVQCPTLVVRQLTSQQN